MLTIQSVGYRHSGLYTCVAKNSAGTASSAVQLKVNGRSKTIIIQERENLDSGKVLELQYII
jgi:hypothetical protein